jgi:hypothetical protein
VDFSQVKMGSYLLVPLLVLRLQLESIKSHWACSYPLEFVGNNFIKKNKKIGQRKHIMRESWTWGWLGWFSLFPTKIRGNPNIKEGSLFVFVCIGISLNHNPTIEHLSFSLNRAFSQGSSLSSGNHHHQHHHLWSIAIVSI